MAPLPVHAELSRHGRIDGQPGVIVTYATIRQWTLRFGQQYAVELHRRQPRRCDKSYLDEVVLTIKGKRHYLWRAVDQNGYTLYVLVQSRRDLQAAKRFFRKLLGGLRYALRVLITDKLKSYAAAKVNIMPGVEHRQHKELNNRAELSHQPTRQQERQMRSYKSPEQVQRFLSVHGRSTTSSGAGATACRRSSTGTSVLKHFRFGTK